MMVISFMRLYWNKVAVGRNVVGQWHGDSDDVNGCTCRAISHGGKKLLKFGAQPD